jgi:hypothetical protein
MKKVIFLYMLLSLGFSSCGSLISLIYGVRDSKVVSSEAVLDFKSKYISDQGQMCYAEPTVDHEWFIPEPFLFDAQGRAIDYRIKDNPGCTAPLSVLISGLDSTSRSIIGNQENMSTFASHLKNFPCDSSEFVPSKADYHLFITWATWTGKLVYRQRVNSWIEAAISNKKVRISVYLINMDQVVCH